MAFGKAVVFDSDLNQLDMNTRPISPLFLSIVIIGNALTTLQSITKNREAPWYLPDRFWITHLTMPFTELTSELGSALNEIGARLASAASSERGAANAARRPANGQ